MKKVAILYIALGRYTVFWDDFYKSCEQYLGPCEKHYFVWTDNPAETMKNKNVTIIPAQKRGWPYDTLLRFEMFLGAEKELKKFDYIFFFNANFQFYNPVDLAEITPREWHDGLVAGLHRGAAATSIKNRTSTRMKDVRNPRHIFHMVGVNTMCAGRSTAEHRTRF